MTTKRLESCRKAAQAVGVASTTVERWVRIGYLGEGPWTLAQVRKAQNKAADNGRHGGIRAAHGTETRWRAGCPCDECLAAHNAHLRGSRRAQALNLLADHKSTVIEILSSGGTFEEVKEETGLTPQRLHGIAKWNEEWCRELDDALMSGRDPDIAHGTEWAYPGFSDT
jgi:hypothetical protein